MTQLQLMGKELAQKIHEVGLMPEGYTARITLVKTGSADKELARKIIGTVCREYGIEPRLLQGRNRRHPLPFARCVASVMIYRHTAFGYKQVDLLVRGVGDHAQGVYYKNELFPSINVEAYEAARIARIELRIEDLLREYHANVRGEG